MTGGFFDIKLIDVVVIGGGIIAWLQYRNDRAKTIRERRKEDDDRQEAQIKMHTENRERLSRLAEFHEDQIEVNRRHSELIIQLGQQTTALKEIATASNRRLEMLENRRT